MKTTHRGMASVEVILAIATGALVLLGTMQLANSSFLPKTNETISKLLSSELTSTNLNDESTGENDSTPDNNPNLGSNSDGDSNSDSQGLGNGGGEQPETESVAPPTDGGEIKPVGDALIKDLILETLKQGAEDWADSAVDKAEEELRNYVKPSLPMGVDLGLEDWDLQKAKSNKLLVDKLGIILGATSAVDGLTQAEQEVKDLADQGEYQEAFGKIFSGSSRFVTDAVLSSKVVDDALSKLPSKAQIAIKSTIPNVIESASQALGEKVFDSVGKKINDKLWSWYDKGYLPRVPRIPRDFEF